MCSKAWLAAPVLLAHAKVTKTIICFSMGPKRRHPAVVTVGKSLSHTRNAVVAHSAHKRKPDVGDGVLAHVEQTREEVATEPLLSGARVAQYNITYLHV
jgi:hypothetical protein